MNEKMITLGNRKYRVGFEEGQEQELERAVELYNGELQKLSTSGVGMRENQHLMLGGLMLAYRFADNEAGQNDAKERIRSLEVEFARTKDQLTHFTNSEKELQNQIKKLGDEKAALVAELDKVKSDQSAQNSEEMKALQAEIDKLRSDASEQISATDYEKALAELTKMRTELSAAKSENEKLRAAAASQAEEKPANAEDGIASALGEIVSGLEGLTK